MSLIDGLFLGERFTHLYARAATSFSSCSSKFPSRRESTISSHPTFPSVFIAA
ncbi:hypothetical protein Hanom_Chr03g00233081 [Helianthus anomalus]